MPRIARLAPGTQPPPPVEEHPFDVHKRLTSIEDAVAYVKTTEYHAHIVERAVAEEPYASVPDMSSSLEKLLERFGVERKRAKGRELFWLFNVAASKWLPENMHPVFGAQQQEIGILVGSLERAIPIVRLVCRGTNTSKHAEHFKLIIRAGRILSPSSALLGSLVHSFVIPITARQYERFARNDELILPRPQEVADEVTIERNNQVQLWQLAQSFPALFKHSSPFLPNARNEAAVLPQDIKVFIEQATIEQLRSMRALALDALRHSFEGRPVIHRETRTIKGNLYLFEVWSEGGKKRSRYLGPVLPRRRRQP